MEETLVSLETAKLAKEKGLKYEDVYQSFRPNGDFTFGRNDDIFYPAPTQSLLQKYLRELHKIFVYVVPVDYWDKYKYVILCENVMSQDSEVNHKTYKTFEEALDVALQKALKLLPPCQNTNQKS